MAKIARNNNKLHIANGSSNSALFFGSVVDDAGYEKYVASADRLLKPGAGAATSGDLPFMLHGNDLGIGASVLGLKGPSVLVYTDGVHEPQKFTISGANNLVLACIVPNVAGGYQVLIVDNVSSDTGCKLYSMSKAQFITHLAADGVQDVETVNFDFTGIQIGHYGNSIRPDPTDTLLGTDAGIAGGDYIGDGFNTTESLHFLYNASTASEINPFYITDIKCTSAANYVSGGDYPTILFQFQNISNDTIYNANDCVIYRTEVNGSSNPANTLTYDIDNLHPAFAPCEWMAANRSLISKNYIENGGDTVYFNPTPTANVHPENDTSKINYGGDSGWIHVIASHQDNGSLWRGNLQLSDSSVVFPFDDCTYLTALREHLTSADDMGYMYLAWATMKWDLYGRILQHGSLYISWSSHGNPSDSNYQNVGDRYTVCQWGNEDGYGLAGDNGPQNVHYHDSYGDNSVSNQTYANSGVNISDIVKGMGGLWFHGSAKVNYPKSAIVVTKNAAYTWDSNADTTDLQYQRSSILVSPAPHLAGTPSNFWTKYIQLSTVDGFQNMVLDGQYDAHWDGGVWGSMLASRIEDARVHEAKMSTITFLPEDVISLPISPGNGMDQKFNAGDDTEYHSAFMTKTGHIFGQAVRTEGRTRGADGVWACTVPAGTSRSHLRSAGHPLFLIDTSSDSMILHPMHTLKNWPGSGTSGVGQDGGISLLGDISDDGIGDVDSFGVDTGGRFFSSMSANWASLSAYTDHRGPVYLSANSTLANAATINAYDWSGYRPWTWNYGGALGLDRILSNISIQDVWYGHAVTNTSDTGNSDLNATPNGLESHSQFVPNYRVLTNHFNIAYAADGEQKIFNHTISSVTPANQSLNSTYSGLATVALEDGSIVFTPVTADAEATTVFDMDITAEAGADDNFIAPYIVTYKYTFLYDGYQESPLALIGETDNEPANNKEGYKIKLSFLLSSIDYRITHVNVYSKYKKSNGSGDSEFKLSKSIPFRPIEIWGFNNTTGLHEYEYMDRNAINPTYETLTSIPESLTDSSMMYSICTAADSYLFVAGCSQPTLSDDFSHYIFRSIQGSFSQFNWSRDFQILPEIPVAMQSFNGKLFIFSPSRTFKLNQSSLEVEDDFLGAGCIDDRALVSTEYGMCFADQKNIYLHNGQAPQVISQSIARGGKDSYLDGSGGWQDTSKTNICITFDAQRKSFLIFFSYNVNEGLVNRCWAYNLLYKRWDLLSSPGKITDTFIESDGTVMITASIDSAIETYRFLAGSSFKPWTWISKDIIVNHATQDKKLKKVRINSTAALTDGDVTLSRDNGTNIPFTATEELANGLYHKAMKPDSSTTFKSTQIALTAIDGNIEVDSIGLIYRPKSIK